jgi:hypothetical protein
MAFPKGKEAQKDTRMVGLAAFDIAKCRFPF